MRKFEFKLEAVLQHREACEQQAAIEQARAAQEYKQHYDSLSMARQKLAQVQSVEPADPFDMFNKISYCDYMAGKVKNKESLLESSLNKLETCRKNLVEAMQKRFVIENLKERQQRSYNQELAMLEQKENDEMATRQFVCRKLENN